MTQPMQQISPMPYGKANEIVHVGNNAGNAHVTYNIYNCSGGRGCQHCQPGRASTRRYPFWLQWIVRFCVRVLRDVRQQRRTIRDLTRRLEAVEGVHANVVTPAELNVLVDARVRAIFDRYGAAIHEAMVRNTAAYRPRHPFSWFFGVVGALAGMLMAWLYILSERPATRFPLMPGWTETSLINSNGHLVVWLLIGGILGAIGGSFIGRMLDNYHNRHRLAEQNNSAAQEAIQAIDNKGV